MTRKEKINERIYLQIPGFFEGSLKMVGLALIVNTASVEGSHALQYLGGGISYALGITASLLRKITIDDYILEIFNELNDKVSKNIEKLKKSTVDETINRQLQIQYPFVSKDDFSRLRKRFGDDLEFVDCLKRRSRNEPMEYLLEKANFLGRKFKVTKNTYVPNKETELLVEYLIQNENLDGKRVLDVGTGCGNIAISLKRKVDNVSIYASDISEKALEIAKQNAKKHNTEIADFFVSNYVDDVPVEPNYIISDLPWGHGDSKSDYTLKSIDNDELKHMPQIAVYHPDGDMVAYEELFESIQKKSWHPKLFIETGLMPKHVVEKAIPKCLDWKYIPMKDYSITEIYF
ncbi:class I SAM-dependent methyltransferase [Candidatus Woesearchaeota archaeon]|nr:class I SAM-dependent methyltransferase [Candidatus Woesearchaeota archaeon]